MASYFMRHGFYLMGVLLRGVRRVREVTGVRGSATLLDASAVLRAD
jgi:hypothetical protein